MTSYVYAFRDGARVKIGFSHNPFRRLQQIRASHKTAMLVGLIEGNRKTEQRIHKLLSPWREDGEWFFLSDRVADFLNSFSMPAHLPEPQGPAHERKELPSASIVRNLLSYDPSTGFLFWLDSKSRFFGRRAGSLKLSDGYRRIGIEGQKYFEHRIIWLHVYGVEPPDFLDHRNHECADNRIANLRAATRSQNAINFKRDLRPYWGVTAVRSGWQVQIRCGGRTHYVGYFATLDQAILAHTFKAKELFGEFAADPSRQIPPNVQRPCREPYTSPVSWSDDEFAVAKTMWGDGLPASAICKQIGRSRNAVIGKLFRGGRLSEGRHIEPPSLGVSL